MKTLLVKSLFITSTILLMFGLYGCSKVHDALQNSNDAELTTTTTNSQPTSTPTSTATPTPSPTPDPDRKITSITKNKVLYGQSFKTEEVLFEYNDKGLVTYCMWGNSNEYYYEYDDQDRLIWQKESYAEFNYDTNENNCTIYEYYYDENNQLVSVDSTDYAFNYVDNGVTKTTVLKYEDGMFVETSTGEKVSYNPDGTLKMLSFDPNNTREYIYDDNGQLTQMISTWSYGWKCQEITYYEPADDANFMFESDPYTDLIMRNIPCTGHPVYELYIKSLIGLKPIRSEVLYQYDNHGNELCTPETTYIYDKDDHLINQISNYGEKPSPVEGYEDSFQDGQIKDIEYTYNEFGELISEKETWTNGWGDEIISVEYTYEYTYDR